MNPDKYPPHPDTIDALLSLPVWDYFRESKLGYDLFISDPDRATRIYNAAEYGGDGSTHAEVIDDWRKLADQLRADCERFAWEMEDETEAETFEAEYGAAFDRLAESLDACEAWHETNGSLHQPIG